MQALVRVVLTLILLVAAGLLSYDMASYYLYSPWTRDARIRANVVTVAPSVSGHIIDIPVRNDQFVHKGDVLFVIDPEGYRIALADAEATLAARLAQHQMVLDQYQRRSKLTPGYTISAEALDNARRQSETAGANYQQAIASRDNAALNVRRTEVRATVNGFVTNLNLAKGAYATQGRMPALWKMITSGSSAWIAWMSVRLGVPLPSGFNTSQPSKANTSPAPARYRAPNGKPSDCSTPPG
jgi:multidrug resistance efflux pump